MNKIGYIIALTLILFLYHVHADEDWRISEVDGWVNDVSFDATSETLSADAISGIHYLLLDKQYRITNSEVSTYYHFANRIENQSGISELSQLAITFDPSYEILKFHEIVVHRGGTLSSRLSPDAVSVLRREQRLDYQIIDGRKTAHIVLDDVRVGDIIEYSYTLSGANPVFSGRFFDISLLQFSVPVGRLYLRVLWNKDSAMHYKTYNCEGIEPTIQQQDGNVEYIWDLHDRPAVHWEDYTPTWYQPYSELQISETHSWEEVIEWALPLYQITSADASLCRQLALSVISGEEGNRQKADDLLEYVQKEIRYTGLEIGLHSYAPNPPTIVLDRHFGDCKDKSLLLISLFEAVGIDAYPALVSNSLRGHVEEMLPSPLAFDHVIVFALIDGKEYFLDPTLTFNEGFLDDTPSRFYGKALIVKKGTTDLVSISESELPGPTIIVTENFDSTEGIDGPVHLRIETEYRRFSTKNARAYVDSLSMDQLEEEYINFLERYYPGLQSQKPVEIRDDTEANELIILESYLIPKMWQYDEEYKLYELTVHPYQLYPYTIKPDTLRRKAPLALPYPLHTEHIIEVELFEPWPVDDHQVLIENPAFSYSSRVGYSQDGKHVRISHRLKTLKDSVPPKELNRYLKDLEKMDEDLGFVFSFHEEDTSPRSTIYDINWQDLLRNWNFIIITAFTLLASIVLARKLYIFDPPPVPHTNIDLTLRGVSGWLILFAFNLYVTPLGLLFALGITLPSYEMTSWRLLTDSSYNNFYFLWGLLLTFELIINIGMVVLSILLIVLFRKRQHTFPRLYIIINVVWTVLVLLDMLAAHLMFRSSSITPENEYYNLIGNIVAAIVWCFYVGYSNRVKATFTERLQRTENEARAV